MTQKNERTKKAEHVRIARVTRQCYMSYTFELRALHERVTPYTTVNLF